MSGTSLINDYFDSVVYLTTKHRPGRDSRMQQELKNHHIEAQKIYAVDQPSARISFNMSMMKILKIFIDSGQHKILVLEDDCVFQNMNCLNDVLDQLDHQITWDMFYMGANTWNFPLEVVSKNLVRVFGAWTTHAHAYTREGALAIFDQFSKVSLDNIVYDDWLAHNFHAHSRCFLAYPMLATQAPNYSDLLESDVNYEVCWTNTNKRIQRALRGWRIKQHQQRIKLHR